MSETDIDKDKCILHTEKTQRLELSIVKIEGDVRHIRDRIDNGLSATISKIWEKINEMAVDRAKMETMVANNSSFLDKMKDAFIKVSISGVAIGILMLVWRYINFALTIPTVIL